MGLGLMFVFGTTMTMVSQHFRGRRALAMVSGGCRTNFSLYFHVAYWSGDLHSVYLACIDASGARPIACLMNTSVGKRNVLTRILTGHCRRQRAAGVHYVYE